MIARWNNQLIAESANTVVVEGNHYFPAADVNSAMLAQSAHTTVCPWKGTAHYYSLEVDGQTNTNAAWCYLDPKPAAQEIAGRIAFWKGVAVSES